MKAAYFVLLSGIWLSACGGGAGSAQAPDSPPRVTATPVAIKTPLSSPEPTLLPTAVPTVVPSSLVSPSPIASASPDIAPENVLTPNPLGDISYRKLVNRSPDCADYAGSYNATIYDHQQNTYLNNSFEIVAGEFECIFRSNNIPNHDLGHNTTTGGNFASAAQENSGTFVLRVPRNPVRTNQASYVRKVGGYLTLNGIMLNGVDLDMDSAFCYNPDFTGPNNIGLGTREQCGLFADWYAIPAANPNNVVLDQYTGHTFDGRYHYHGDNDGLSNVEPGDILDAADIASASGSPVIGFAPDGFPIYGHYFYDKVNKQLRKARSSWKTYTTERTRPVGSDTPAPLIETHPRGLFVEDWYYSAGSGDLDECNGMTDAYGNYGYYYTETYPYGPLCTFGSPDSSFVQQGSAFSGRD